MRVETDQLKKFIVDSGLLSETDLSRAEEDAREKNISLKQVLLGDGHISEDDLRRMEAYVLGIPFINFKDHKIDFSTLALIPEPIARRHNIIAFKKTDDSLEVAMLDTDDLAAIDFVKRKWD